MATINSYQTAKAYLNGKVERKIPSIKETSVHLYPDGMIRIKHWGTYIITYFSDGKVMIDCRGYRSKTTKDRINDYSPVRVYQKNYEWFLWDGTPYRDGMIFDADGKLLTDAVLTTS